MDTFTRSFFQALLWSETDIGPDGSMGDNFETYSPEDIETERRKELESDCESFQADNWADICEDLSRAGMDFCLTRNRHGAGFWDGDWPPDVGSRLTEAAHAYGSVHLTLGDDDKLYVTG